MKSRRVLIGAGFVLVISAALLPLMNTARAQSVCCNDVKFPGNYESYGEGAALAIVDGIGRGRHTYASIQAALNNVARDGQVQIKTPPGGVYELEDRPLQIRRPVTISAFDDSSVVRIHARGRCATVALRREGKVAITGLSFESDGNDDGCIVVEQAGKFTLKDSDITVTRDALPTADRCVPIVAGKRRPKGEPSCGFSGVVILSGVARLEDNTIRRTGTAIALLNAGGSEEHMVAGNYIAGNAVGVYADNGSRYRIEGNGIFRNHNIGVDLADGTGTVRANDIEDNWTGLKIVPPSAFGSRETGYRRGQERAATVMIENNLVTQYGVYRPNSYDIYHDNGGDRVNDPNLTRGEKSRYGYALDFVVGGDYVDDNVYDYPKQGSVLSGIEITGNCFFGPATAWFDRDRFMPLIAPSEKDSKHEIAGDWDRNGGPDPGNFHRPWIKDAATPLWFFDSNTWVEHLDYDGVDKIDHDNAIYSPRHDGSMWPFNRSMWTAVHNWFARNKKEMTCGGRPVVGAPGDWPRFDTGPMR